MRIKGRRITAGVIGLALAAIVGAGASAFASVPLGSVPLAGDWEGAGPHGLPLSFSLVRQGNRLVAGSIALGGPSTCPANERDAETVALSQITYRGPGDGSGQSSGAALLSGQLPGRSGAASIRGEFATPTSGTFSIQIKSTPGCGWPKGILTWQVHRARRLRLADRTWTASLTAPEITAGTFTLVVAGQGRVIRSLHTSFGCQTATANVTGGFNLSPAYEFIRPDGSFYSPTGGYAVKHHRVRWQGWLNPTGTVTGTARVYDPCDERVIVARIRR